MLCQKYMLYVKCGEYHMIILTVIIKQEYIYKMYIHSLMILRRHTSRLWFEFCNTWLYCGRPWVNRHSRFTTIVYKLDAYAVAGSILTNGSMRYSTISLRNDGGV